MPRSAFVFDTDMGADDALALAIAARLAPTLGELHVISCFGNVPEAQAFANGAALLPALGCSAPIYRGAVAPSAGDLVSARHAHGEDGLGGGAEILAAAGAPLAAAGDLGALIAALEGYEEIRWLALGPATNLARLQQEGPSLFARLASVTLMGGALFDVGNMTPHAEFNAKADAPALQALLATGRPLALVPLDVCRKVQFRYPEIVAFLAGLPDAARRTLEAAHENYCRRYQEWEGFFGCFPHDSVALIAAARPDLFFSVAGEMACAVGGAEEGRTRFVRMDEAGPHAARMGGDLHAVRRAIASLGAQF